MKEAVKEKRRYERFKVPYCVEYKNREGSLGVIRDISKGGICVILDKTTDIPKNRVVSLSILFPDTTMKVSGKVVWTRALKNRSEVGLDFANRCDIFKEGSSNRILKYLAKT